MPQAGVQRLNRSDVIDTFNQCNDSTGSGLPRIYRDIEYVAQSNESI